MIGFRLSAERPPEARAVAGDAVMRLEHLYEVDPSKMTDHVRQQDMPVWDSRRIANSRSEHLDWMHDHFADTVISGADLLEDNA